MASLKGLAERTRSVHNFSLVSEDGLQLDFSLREPSGVDETVDFVGDYRATTKKISAELLKTNDMEALSIDEKLDLIDELFEIKFRFCVKWLRILSTDEVSEDDCVKAYELVGKVDMAQDTSLFYQISQASGLLQVNEDLLDGEGEEIDERDFTT